MRPTEEERRKRNREYQRKYRNKPGVKEARRKLNRDWIARNREQYNKSKAAYRFKLKLAALEYYSGGSMACAQCGFSDDLDALCLDHINDDGAEHRKELGCSSRTMSGGTTIYERLKAYGWMDGLQVLCANCNMIKELRRKRNGMSADEMKSKVSKPLRWKNEDTDTSE